MTYDVSDILQLQNHKTYTIKVVFQKISTYILPEICIHSVVDYRLQITYIIQ